MLKKLIGLFIIGIFVISFIFTGCSTQSDSEDIYYADDYEEEYDEDFDDEEYDEDYDEEEFDEEFEDNNVGTNPVNLKSSYPNTVAYKLNLQKYQLPGVFTMLKPKGWNVYKAGEYNTIAFLTRDDVEPLRQVFLFSEIGLFYVDESQKELEQYYQNNGGYSIPWIDMPVISPFDGTTFFYNFNAIMEAKFPKSFLAAGNMPKPSGFEQIEIISEEPIESIIPGLPATLVRAILTQDGKTAQGVFVASGIEDGFGHATALMVTGITAPVGEFQGMQESLLEIVRSFELDSAYVQEGLRVLQQNGERLSEISKTLSETSDIITKGWTERNRLDDIRIAKKSDQILGVERVYDPDTGEVYEVKNGFFDYYKTHQSQYDKKNLQPLPDNDPKPWEQAPIINHNLVSP